MAGLFGGQRSGGMGWTDRLAILGAGLQDIGAPGTGNRVNDAATQIALRRQMEEQMRQQQQATALSDRLRAQLSPADGPNGSGTGAAPSVEQQMAALNEARLLNPAVADQFSPYVQGNRMREMTQGLPLNQQLAIELNPERAGQSFATQFEDMPLAAGTVRSRGNQSIAAAPRVDQFGDRYGVYDPITGQTTYSQPRSPTFAENTDRITAERPQIASLSQGQQAFGVDPYGNTTPLAQNNAPRPLSAGQQRQVETYYGDVEALRSINEQLGRFYTPPSAAGGQATGLLATGELNLGPWTNMGASALNMAGRSNENSRNYADFRATLEKLRNDSLRLNNGVQTEGDAQRAWNELFANLNDEGVVTQRLAQIQQINNRAINFRQERIAALEGQGQSQGGQQGPIAVNPQTGQRVQWNGQQWVPIR